MLYNTGEGGITYTFGYPIFEQLEEYTFNLLGYEEYVNYDIENNPKNKKYTVEVSHEPEEQ